MKKILIVALCIMLLVSCANKEVKEVKEDTKAVDLSTMNEVEQFYFAMGNYIANSYSMVYEDMDYKSFALGVTQFEKGQTLTDEQVENIITAYSSKLNSGNLEKSEKFLEENAKKEGVVTTKSGLQYQVITKGSGKSAAEAKVVTCDYELTLSDGSIADSSIQRGTPVQFTIAQLIKGMQEGLALMQEGDTFKFWMHPDLGYGPTGTGSIPGNEVLTFTVSLISVDK